METPPGFNLDHAVAQWRDELARQPGLTPADLRELEAHLRDGFAELRKNSIREEEAFHLACERLGPSQPVAGEFAKAKPARVWVPRVFCLTFLIVFGAFAAVAFLSTPWYLASATVKLVHAEITPSLSGANPNSAVSFTSPLEFNSFLRLMETRDIAQQVASRMSPAERQDFLAPFARMNTSDSSANLVDRLLLQREVYPGRLAYTLGVSIEHTNPHIAAVVADDFAQVFIDAQKTNPRIMTRAANIEWLNHAAGHVNMSEPKVTLLLAGGFVAALLAAIVAAALVHLLTLSGSRRPPAKLAS